MKLCFQNPFPLNAEERRIRFIYLQALYLFSSRTEQILSLRNPQTFLPLYRQDIWVIHCPAVWFCIMLITKSKNQTVRLLNQHLCLICFRTPGWQHSRADRHWICHYSQLSWKRVSWEWALKLILGKKKKGFNWATVLASRHMNLICFRSSSFPNKQGLTLPPKCRKYKYF